MARKQLRLNIEENKEAKFQMNEKLLPAEKINRILKRMNMQKGSLVSHGDSKPCKTYCAGLSIGRI
jgi:hypothetical protein